MQNRRPQYTTCVWMDMTVDVWCIHDSCRVISAMCIMQEVAQIWARVYDFDLVAAGKQHFQTWDKYV